MSLEQKYNDFYKGDGVKKEFTDVSVDRWPKNRVESIVHQSGTGESVLDVGCGDGYLLFQMRSKFKTLVGLEYSNDRLKQAMVNLNGFDFKPFRGSAENMDMIESNSIDTIISADTIEHIPDVYLAAQEMYRVLKPGGHLLINTPNIAFVKKRVLLMLGRFPSTSQPNEGFGSDILFDGGHLHYFTYRSLRILFERAGFRYKKKIGFGVLGSLHNLYPELLSGGAQLELEK